MGRKTESLRKIVHPVGLLKGTVSRDFRLLAFSENTIRAVSNFFENSRRYSHFKCNTGVVDTDGKFATGGVDTSGAP
jgi:hypothetical protein